MKKQLTTLSAALALIVMLLVAVPRGNYSSTVPVWNSDFNWLRHCHAASQTS
jgi:hypothetical protein